MGDMYHQSYPPMEREDPDYYGGYSRRGAPMMDRRRDGYGGGGRQQQSYYRGDRGYQSRGGGGDRYYRPGGGSAGGRGGGYSYPKRGNDYRRGGGGSSGGRGRSDFSGLMVKSSTVEDDLDYTDTEWKSKILSGVTRDTRYKTSDVTDTKGSTFEEFDLKKSLLRGIFEQGFEQPSPIQESAIPAILMRRNVLARAKNGTGKTGAYTIPILHLIDVSLKHTQALIMVPTRELAMQTAKVIKDLGKYLSGLNVMCATGGSALHRDVYRLNNTRKAGEAVHIIVGTPGRLADLCSANAADLSKCEIVVMDEADKLLSPDFVELCEKVLYVTSDEKNRQMLLFSASFPSSVQGFCEKWLSDHERLNLMERLTLKGVTQYYAYVQEKEKVHCLYTLLKRVRLKSLIIFCKSSSRVELLARKVNKLGYNCFYTHSGMSQADRSRVFHDFREGMSRILICTDLITRGVDIPSVNIVINFDCPKTDETYLHRIGRAGRFGHLAMAINFITPDDRVKLYALEASLGAEIKPIPKTLDHKLYTQ